MENSPWNKFDLLGPNPEPSPTQKAVLESMKRVQDLGDPHDLTIFVVDKSSEEISDYLEKNKSEFSPEEIFYLQTTVQLRKEVGK